MRATWTPAWIAGIAAALVVADIAPSAAQQAPAGTSATTPAATSTAFPNSRGPLSAGFNPAVTSPFSPDIRRSFSGGFGTGAITPFGIAPVGMLGSLGTGIAGPFFPDIRQPLSGTFNPAAAAPFNGVFGAATRVPNTLVPAADGSLGTAPFFVGPSGGFITPGGAVVSSWNGTPVVLQPVPVPVYVPVPESATQNGSSAAVARRGTTRQAPARTTLNRERRSAWAAEQLMARTPLTEGTVISDTKQTVSVRVGKQVRRYPRAQVFFFTNRGELRSSAIETTRLSRGHRVLVPVRPIAAG